MSRNLCCVKDCKNTKHEKPRLRFHNFPLKEAERLKKWVKFCENETLTELYERNDPKLSFKIICSEHFEDNKYNNPLKKIRLMCNALPTIKSNQKKPTLDFHIKCQPKVEVIPAQVLLRTNLSRSWRPSLNNTSDLSSNELNTESEDKNKTNEEQTKTQTKETEVKPKSNPIVKYYSSQYFRHIDEIKNLREKLSKSKKQVMNLKYRLKRAQPMGNTRKSKLNYIIKNIKTLGEDVLNPLMSEIIEYHLISAFLNKPRVPKWSNRMKKFCADLYHKSPSAYSYLQKTMTLPTKKTILKFIVDRIQIAKNETFKQNINQQNDKQINCSVDQTVDKFNDHEMIIGGPMDVLLSNNDLNNITIEYNSCEESNGELIGVATIGSHPNCDDSGRVLTTQITLIEDSNPSMTGTDQ